MAGPIYASQHDDANGVDPSASEDGDGVVPVPLNPEPWGKPFPIEWITTTALPFRLVRHIRNSWNGNVWVLLL